MKILLSQITLSYLIHYINIFLQNKRGFVVELVFRQVSEMIQFTVLLKKPH